MNRIRKLLLAGAAALGMGGFAGPAAAGVDVYVDLRGPRVVHYDHWAPGHHRYVYHEHYYSSPRPVYHYYDRRPVHHHYYNRPHHHDRHYRHHDHRRHHRHDHDRRDRGRSWRDGHQRRHRRG